MWRVETVWAVWRAGGAAGAGPVGWAAGRLMKEGTALAGNPLERTGKVVSGKKGRTVADGPFAESKEAIGGYFLLNVEDLDANRAGRLSERQKYRLTRGWRRTLWILIGLVIFLGLAATTMLFVAQRSASPVLNVIGILLAIVNAAIVALGTQSYLRTSSDIKNGRVAIISGVVSHTLRVSGRVAKRPSPYN